MNVELGHARAARSRATVITVSRGTNTHGVDEVVRKQNRLRGRKRSKRKPRRNVRSMPP